MPDVKMPDGKILRFPEETSLEVIDKAAKNYINGISSSEPAPAPAPEPTPEPSRPNFFERVGEDINKRGEMAMDIKDAGMSGEQTAGETVLQLIGKVGAGSVLDIIGEGVVSAGYGVQNVTPDPVEDWIKTYMFDPFVQQPLVKEGLSAMQSGTESYQNWAENNPRLARNFDALANTALVAAPVKTKPTTSQGPSTIAKMSNTVQPKSQSILGATAKAIDESAEQTINTRRQSFLEDLVRPAQTKGVREEQVKRTTESGILNTKNIAPSTSEAKAISSIENIPSVKPSNTLQKNYNNISSELTKEAQNLSNTLRNSKVIIPKSEVDDVFNSALKTLEESPVMVGDAAKTGARYINQAKTIVNNHPPTSLGLLNARKEFDQYVSRQKPKILDPATENAASIAVKEVRQSINNLIASKNPQVAVRDSLSRQSSMYTALDNIGKKAADEGANAIARISQGIDRILGQRSKVMNVMGLAAGVGTFAVYNAYAAQVSALAYTLAGMYAGGKFFMSPQFRKSIAATIRQADKAIKKATDPDTIKSLRADRALVVEMLRQANNSGE